MLTYLSFFQVVIGEQIVGMDPDCPTCPLAQRFFPQPSDITVHPDFRKASVQSQGNDILLIRLPGLVQTVNENSLQLVMPICLPWRRAAKKDKLYVAGWGEREGNQINCR